MCVCVDILFKFLLEFYLLKRNLNKIKQFPKPPQKPNSQSINKLDIEYLNTHRKNPCAVFKSVQCGCFLVFPFTLHYAQKHVLSQLKNKVKLRMKKSSIVVFCLTFFIKCCFIFRRICFKNNVSSNARTCFFHIMKA